MTNRPVTAHLPGNLVRALSRSAERLGRSQSSIVREAVEDWLDREMKRDRLTLDALASADAGRLIEHERVERWIESLGLDDQMPVPRP